MAVGAGEGAVNRMRDLNWRQEKRSDCRVRRWQEWLGSFRIGDAHASEHGGYRVNLTPIRSLEPVSVLGPVRNRV